MFLQWIFLTLLSATAFVLSSTASSDGIFILLIPEINILYTVKTLFKKKVIINLIIYRPFSHPGVSLNCNKTVEVKAEEMVTLKCTIHLMQSNCKVEDLLWNNTHTQERISCDSGSDYICRGDKLTYVSLTITKVMKEEIYTVHISTDCGMAESSITVVLGE